MSQLIELFLFHNESNQVLRFSDGKLTIIREIQETSLFPVCIKKTFEISVFENVPNDYVHTLKHAILTIDKKEYEKKISRIINQIL